MSVFERWRIVLAFVIVCLFTGAAWLYATSEEKKIDQSAIATQRSVNAYVAITEVKSNLLFALVLSKLHFSSHQELYYDQFLAKLTTIDSLLSDITANAPESADAVANLQKDLESYRFTFKDHAIKIKRIMKADLDGTVDEMAAMAAVDTQGKKASKDAELLDTTLKQDMSAQLSMFRQTTSAIPLKMTIIFAIGMVCVTLCSFFLAFFRQRGEK